MLAFQTSPLYLMLHESIYCNAGGSSAWAAERVYQTQRLFHAETALAEGKEVMFTGEMVFLMRN